MVSVFCHYEARATQKTQLVTGKTDWEIFCLERRWPATCHHHSTALSWQDCLLCGHCCLVFGFLKARKGAISTARMVCLGAISDCLLFFLLFIFLFLSLSEKFETLACS